MKILLFLIFHQNKRFKMNFEKNTFVSKICHLPSPNGYRDFWSIRRFDCRKLAPAILNLPNGRFAPIALFSYWIGRKEMSDLDFVDFLEKSKKSFKRAVDLKVWKDLIPNISFLAGGYGELESFNKLSQKISNIEEELSEPVQCLFYISTPS